MAQRRTNTDKWKGVTFFRTLPPDYKLLWLYIQDACDYTGIWRVDFEIARIYTGADINEQIALEFFGENVTVFDGGAAWYIPGFVAEQYGDRLNPSNKVHAGVIAAYQKVQKSARPLVGPMPDLVSPAPAPLPGQGNFEFEPKTNLMPGAIEGLASPKLAHIDIDIDIDKNKNNKVIDSKTFLSANSWPVMPKAELFEALFSDQRFIENLAIVHPKKDYRQAFEEMYMHFSNNKRPPQELGEWKQKLNTWLTNCKPNGTTEKKRTSGRDLASRLGERLATDVNTGEHAGRPGGI